jgi:hypothetical protein
MYKTLEEIRDTHNIIFTNLEKTKKYNQTIIDIYNDNVTDYISLNDNIINYHIGCYYMINKNYNMMKIYFSFAIKQGNELAMYELGNYFSSIENNNKKMIKYYKMASDNGNAIASFRLAQYYSDYKINYTEMCKYYTITIENGIKYSEEKDGDDQDEKKNMYFDFATLAISHLSYYSNFIKKNETMM